MNKDMCCPVCGNYIDVEEIYRQGKADQKAEDNEFFNFEGAWRLEKQKIRAEVIDELVDAVCCHSAFTNMQKDAIKIYAEQLKEQK